MHGIVKSRVIRKQHSLICHYTAIARSHENNLWWKYKKNHSCIVYFSVIPWNTLQDMQNIVTIAGYKELVITGTAQSHKPLFISKLQNPNPVRIRFLLGKLESESCRAQPKSGSKKSKIQSMHTSAA